MELCKKYPVFCTIWAFMEVVLFAGVIFGWGSLVFILKDEGFYVESCIEETLVIDSGFILPEHFEQISTNISNTEPAVELIPASNASVNSLNNTYSIKANISSGLEPAIEGCQAQESRLNLWFSIAVSFMYLSFGGIGYLIQHFGTRATRLTFFIIYLIGTMCLAFASPDTPWLLLPGLCCIGTGGLVVLATNLQVSYLHPHLRSTIVAIFTGLFDFSSINKQIVRIMYENGIARRISYVIISVMFAIIIMISTLFFLPKMNISQDFMNKAEKKKKSKLKEAEGEELEKMNVTDAPVEPSILEPVILHVEAIAVEDDAVADLAIKSNGEHVAKLGLSSNLSIGKDDQRPSLCASIMCVTFILHLLWLFIHALRFVTFIGQLNVWLSNVYDRDEMKVGQMLGIFSYMTMGAIGSALFCGFVYDYLRKCYADSSEIRRVYAPVVIPMVLVVIYSAFTTVCCYVQHEVAVYLAFISFTMFRTSLFTVAVAFIGDAFPAEYFGVMFGMLQVSAGTAGLVQYPVFTWYDAYEGSYMHVNIVLLVLQVVTLIHPIILYIKARRDDPANRKNLYRQEYSVTVPSTA